MFIGCTFYFLTVFAPEYMRSAFCFEIGIEERTSATMERVMVRQDTVAMTVS